MNEKLDDKLLYIKKNNIKTIEEYIRIEKYLTQRLKDLEQIEKEHKEENGRLREELDKKDKIIKEMAKIVYVQDTMSEYGNSREEVINYFTKKARKE